MSNTTTKQSVLLKGLSKKTVVAQFDQDHASADGGAVLLKACDERPGLSASLAACLSDKRQPGKVKHSLQPKSPDRVSPALHEPLNPAFRSCCRPSQQV